MFAMNPSLVKLLVVKIRRARQVSIVDSSLCSTKQETSTMFLQASHLVWPRPLVVASSHKSCSFLKERSVSHPLDSIARQDGFASFQDAMHHKKSMPSRYPMYLNNQTNSLPQPYSRETEECFVCCDASINIMLPCAHYLCYKCLVRLSPNNTYKCPFCKRESTKGDAVRFCPVWTCKQCLLASLIPNTFCKQFTTCLVCAIIV